MDIDQAIKLWNSFQAMSVESTYRRGVCSDCNIDMIIIHSIYTCQNCGLTDISNPILVDNTRWRSKKSVYMRRCYFVELLNLIAGYKQSNSPEYVGVVKRLRRCKFKTIKKLRTHMKRLGYNKYYKYIYNIFADIKKYRVINLERQQIQRLADRFVQFQNVFKKTDHGRKNFFSYNAVIYLILKDQNIKGFKKLLLPRQSRTVIKMIQKYCT